MNSPEQNQQSAAFLKRIARLALLALALCYAAIAGLRTVSDFDLGWQLATGRYVVQHRQVPSTDVFSYTAKGREWIYPPFSGVLFYAAYLLGGFSALSWLSAAACIGTVALVLRNGGVLTAALAVLAVPAIAYRTAPVSDMFTTVLFAAGLSLLWQYRRSSKGPLWLLPACLVLWVNLHLGFIAGLALVMAYAGGELLDSLHRERRVIVLARLRRAAPWLAAACVVTLLNPWGPRIYLAIIRQGRVMEAFGDFVGYWSRVPLSAASLQEALAWRSPESSYWWILAAAGVALAVALRRSEPGAALLLAGAALLSLRYLRFQALFAIVSVVVAGSLLDEYFSGTALTEPRRKKQAVACLVLAAAFCWLVGIRVSDLVSNRYYLSAGDASVFGAGTSWWFPSRAAGFLLRERLPGRVFNDYNVGGYLTWSIGPQYEVYLDGRAVPFGGDLFFKHRALMQQPPDSPEWQRQADLFGFNTLIFSVARYGGLGSIPLRQFCQSRQWRPVYLDEVAVVFLRNLPQNAGWIGRLQIDCETVPFAPPATAGRADLFNFYANAGSVLYMLSRDAESREYLERARRLFPYDPNLYLAKGQLLQANGQMAEAAEEYATSVRVKETDAGWYALGRAQVAQGKYAEAVHSIRRAAARSFHAHDRYHTLGQVYLTMGRFRDALDALDDAERLSPYRGRTETVGADFHAQVALGKARAWKSLGDLAQATTFQEQALKYSPGDPTRWLELAELYQSQGRRELADKARLRAKEIQAR